ncbi:MAG: hypothetical protein ACXVB9_00995 [Bdellovibrionota bacterium]
MFFRQSAAVLSLLALSACSGMGRVYDANALRPVQKVAVVAVDVVQPEEFDLLKPSNSGGGSGPMSHMNIALPTPSPHVNDYVEETRNELHHGQKWQLLPSAKVASNFAVQKYLKDTTEGLQSTQPIPARMTKFRAPELLDVDSAVKIGPAARDEIMNSLGVDAIAFARYDIQLNGTSIMGIGNKHPQANLQISVYARGVEKPIWKDNAQGQEMDDSVGATNLSLDFPKLKDLSIKSSRKAFAEIETRAGEGK